MAVFFSAAFAKMGNATRQESQRHIELKFDSSELRPAPNKTTPQV